MSRIGKHAIALPEGVTVDITVDSVTVKGKLGTLVHHMPKGVDVKLEDNQLKVIPHALEKENRMMWGMMRANLNNMVIGVSTGFSKKLELIGVGYKAQVNGDILKLSLGYSHDIDYKLPAGVKAVCSAPTSIELSSFDKQLLGQVAAEVRSYRPPEPYKGKGVKYETETVLRKVGKKK